jgi:hypothetical protein
MSRHRFADLPGFETVRAPAPPASGFVICPLVGVPGWALPPWWEQVYQWAFAQALAVVSPSRLERLQVAVWN